MPWKNGGGVTHEILKEDRNAKLLWRLSIAEVATNGPFSVFPGLSRILTVIEGEGLELTAQDRVLRALPFKPLSFSGDWPMESRRLRGNVRDFNVIFDGSCILADVIAHQSTVHEELLPQEGRWSAMLCLGGGEANGFDVAAGSLVLAGKETVDLFCRAPALQVTLREI